MFYGISYNIFDGNVIRKKYIYIYWVDIVNDILIRPKHFNFSALVTYSISTIAWAVLGFLLKEGPLVLASFGLGLIFITFLFYRMLSVYYGKYQQQERIKREFIDEIVCCNQDKHIKDVCGVSLRKLAEINILKAENREFEDVYENLLFLETCIFDIKKDYENLSSSNAVKYLEEEYTEMLKSLAVQYPSQIKEYVISKVPLTTEEENRYALRWTVYPWVLEAYPRIGRTELFSEALIQWTHWENQREYAKNYIVNTARKNLALIAETYSDFYSPIGEIDFESAKVFMDALEELFSVDRNTWRAVLKKKHMKYQILDCYKCDDINVNKGRIEVDAKEYFRIYSMLVDCDVANIDRNTWITEGFQFFANLSKNTTDDNKVAYLVKYYLLIKQWIEKIIEELLDEMEKSKECLELLGSMIQSILKYRSAKESDVLLGYIYFSIESKLPIELRIENSLELKCFEKIRKKMIDALMSEIYSKNMAGSSGGFFFLLPDLTNITQDKLEMINGWLDKLNFKTKRKDI